jgi:hypothetical protein
VVVDDRLRDLNRVKRHDLRLKPLRHSLPPLPAFRNL